MVIGFIDCYYRIKIGSMIKNLICEWLGHNWEFYDEKDNLFIYRCINCGDIRSNDSKEFAKQVKASGRVNQNYKEKSSHPQIEQ